MPDAQQDRTPVHNLMEDGNIYAITGRARKALKRAGRSADAEAMSKRVSASGSYAEAVNVVLEYVVMDDGDE